MARSSREIEVQLTLERLSKNVRILPPISGRFVRSRRLRPDSAKTYGNSVRWRACRKTCGFLEGADSSFIARFSAFPEND
jgi:hypothetical protein